MLTDTKRYGQILSARDPSTFARLLHNYEPFYIHDIDAFVGACANLELHTLSFSKEEKDPLVDILETLYWYLTKFPMQEVTYKTMEMIINLSRRLYKDNLLPQIDLLNLTPEMPSVIACIVACQTTEEIESKVTKEQLELLVRAVLDAAIPTYNSAQIVMFFSDVPRFKKIMFEWTDQTIFQNLNKEITDSSMIQYQALDPLAFSQEALQVKRYLTKLFTGDSIFLEDFITSYQNGKIAYGTYNTSMEELHGRYSKYFPDQNQENSIEPDLMDCIYELNYCFREAAFPYTNAPFDELLERAQNNIIHLVVIAKPDSSSAVVLAALNSMIGDIYRCSMIKEQVNSKDNFKVDKLYRSCIEYIHEKLFNPNETPMAVKVNDFAPKNDAGLQAVDILADTPTANALEAYDRTSNKVQSATAKIYHAYKNYKNAEQKVDSQITKMCQAAKRLAIGDTRTEIIEGKKFSAIGLLKQALGTAAVFAFGPIKGLILLVVRYALKKNVTQTERRKILLEMQVELDMLNEKIEDAKGDGNRQAKYNMMRTRAELQAAMAKIRYSTEVDQKMLNSAKSALDRHVGGGMGGRRGKV